MIIWRFFFKFAYLQVMESQSNMSFLALGIYHSCPQIQIQIPIQNKYLVVNINFSPSKLYGSSKARFLAKNQL